MDSACKFPILVNRPESGRTSAAFCSCPPSDALVLNLCLAQTNAKMPHAQICTHNHALLSVNFKSVVKKNDTSLTEQLLQSVLVANEQIAR